MLIEKAMVYGTKWEEAHGGILAIDNFAFSTLTLTHTHTNREYFTVINPF